MDVGDGFVGQDPQRLERVDQPPVVDAPGAAAALPAYRRLAPASPPRLRRVGHGDDMGRFVGGAITAPGGYPPPTTARITTGAPQSSVHSNPP